MRLSDKQAVRLAVNTYGQTATAKMFNVSRKTIYRWLAPESSPYYVAKIPTSAAENIAVGRYLFDEAVAAEVDGQRVKRIAPRSKIIGTRRVLQSQLYGGQILSSVLTVNITGFTESEIADVLADVWTDRKRRGESSNIVLTMAFDPHKYFETNTPQRADVREKYRNLVASNDGELRETDRMVFSSRYMLLDTRDESSRYIIDNVLSEYERMTGRGGKPDELLNIKIAPKNPTFELYKNKMTDETKKPKARRKRKR